MEKFLRPERLDATPNSPTALKDWRHWFRTFNTFLTSISALEPDKLATLCNFVSPSVYEFIANRVSYDAAIQILQDFKDCNFKAVTAEANRDEYIRDALINGLLENKTLDLATAFDQARALDLAQRNSEFYLRSQAPVNAATVPSPDKIDSYDSPLLAATQQPKCFFCDCVPFTAFEADGKLYQFCRVPFGVTNGVACFQRTIDEFIRRNELLGTFAYIDTTIAGSSQQEHDKNLSRFLKAAKKSKFTLNENKSVFSATSIDLLGYTISQGTLKSDTDRLRPLKELSHLKDLPALRRMIGLFSYYSQWISHFSDKVRPLVKAQTFPFQGEAESAFENLKKGTSKCGSQLD
ncbi:pol Retrovirus-related Pol polyprotein from transposon-like 16 [Homarus americanus]|uniref:Pol Retrovirus-related Pol polyprotein from transposon-like 16 n=1 Tax=Homarus americanus TaxID=6706 RepID=A0A8J5JU72_HOMAM|nr:pol Retrovirus-related Pol polyprotein from transposon-like 16 [Homarus americanus]